MRISYLDGTRLRRGLLAGAEYVQRWRAELNRINVFPVPDGDTGTNFSLTLVAVADRLRASRSDHIGTVAREAAEAGILGARGNCGMILSHFLLGFSESVGERARLYPTDFALALQHAGENVYRALERPVEGTIITVIRETAEEARATPTNDFVVLFDRILERARDALARTPTLLPQLRAAGVVDAGAKGFVHLLEGIVAYVEGDPIVALEEPPAYSANVPTPIAAAAAEYPSESERFRYCAEGLVRGENLPTAETVRMELRERGDSLIVLVSGSVLKIHIHTDEPDAIFEILRGHGELVTHKAEDMHAQHAAVERAAAGHVQLARRPVAVLADTACDLPDVVVRAHGIHLVPLSLIFDQEVLRDRVDISAEEFTGRLLAGEHPTTSQPAPASFLQGFKRAAEDGETVIAVLLSGRLSGTYASAEAAAKLFTEAPVQLVDSRAASLLQGLLTLRAAELAENGVEPREICRRLASIRDRSGIFFTVDTFDRLLASGRVGRGKAFIGSLLDIKPILALDPLGRVVPLGRVRGRENVLPKVLELMTARIPAGAATPRFGVIHVACPEVAEEVAEAVRSRYPGAEVLMSAASPVLSTHLGAGAWGLAYMVES